MDIYKLKIRIGDAEFEAEGPVEVVQSQFAAFKELLAMVPPNKDKELTSDSIESETVLPITPAPLALEKIMNVEGRVVSLTAHSNSLDDAILLVALGQKTFRNNDAITGGEIIDGLKLSGHVVGRIDRNLDKYASEGALIKIGSGRGSRYRLTNQGMTRAQQIARGVIAMVP